MAALSGGLMAGSESVLDGLRGLILGGHYAAGSRLGEVELAETLGVSRTPIREALRLLASEGLVELTPNKGARVMAWTTAELEEVFALRAQVEGLAARRAAERVGPAELDQLERLAVAHAEATAAGPDWDLDRVYELNSQFHAGVVRAAAGGTSLTSVVGSLVHSAVLHRTLHTFDEVAMERSSRHHLEIVAALRNRDPDWAECVMRSHLLAARAALLGPRPVLVPATTESGGAR
jgi:DNA-binding GntR family transcriptional regulator